MHASAVRRDAASSSVDPADVAHFTRLAQHWWDDQGEFALLHKMNRVRIDFMREKLQEVRDWDAAKADVLGQPLPAAPSKLRFLDGMDLLDVGCGGGLLCESTARLGASVTGVDAAEANIRIATLHAGEDRALSLRDSVGDAGRPGSIAYAHTTAETLRDEGRQYDVVTAMEVVEHVADPAEFLRCLASLVRPGGHIFMSTMSRTALSYLLTIFMAEKVLRLVSHGTHNHDQYINPPELVGFFRDLGWIRPDEARLANRPRLPDGAPIAPDPMRVQYETRGTMYVPLLGRWVLAPPSVLEPEGPMRLTELCNYFFWVRRPLDA